MNAFKAVALAVCVVDEMSNVAFVYKNDIKQNWNANNVRFMNFSELSPIGVD